MTDKFILSHRTFLAGVVLLVVLLAGTVNTQAIPPQWAKRVASTANGDSELGIGMTLDRQGNVYVTGWFDGANDLGLTNASGGGQDVFVAKYDSTGALQWARRAGGNTANRDVGRGIGVDDAGNVYVTGGFFGTGTFGSITLTASQNEDFFLAKYDSMGTVQWVKQGSSNNIYGTSLAVDGAGNCYAVAFTDNISPITFPGTTTTLPPFSSTAITARSSSNTTMQGRCSGRSS